MNTCNTHLCRRVLVSAGAVCFSACNSEASSSSTSVLDCDEQGSCDTVAESDSEGSDDVTVDNGGNGAETQDTSDDSEASTGTNVSTSTSSDEVDTTAGNDGDAASTADDDDDANTASAAGGDDSTNDGATGEPAPDGTEPSEATTPPQPTIDAPGVNPSYPCVGLGEICMEASCCGDLICSDEADGCIEPAPAPPPNPDACGLPFERGPCIDAYTVFTHNPETGACEEAYFSGCAGNDNRFDTLEACEATCDCGTECPVPDESEPDAAAPVDQQAPGCTENGVSCEQAADCCEGLACVDSSCGLTADVCGLPIDPGPCKAALSRLAFDSEQGQCVEFTWGGCGGNGSTSKRSPSASKPAWTTSPPRARVKVKPASVNRVAQGSTATVRARRSGLTSSRRRMTLPSSHIPGGGAGEPFCVATTNAG